jgi:hypothetical protein
MGNHNPPTREKRCPFTHLSIEEAIVCAEKHLGSYRQPAIPYWGTMRTNDHLIVGFQLSPTKRWRLDFDPSPKTNKWVHVNEENFDAPPGNQKIAHVVDIQRNDTQVRLYYQKWTSKYGARRE